MKKNKKLVLAVVIVLIVIAALIAVYAFTRPAVQQGAKTITVEVVHKDESSKSFTYHTDAEYLGEVLVTEGLVKGEESEYGLFITEVDGEVADYSVDGGWWAIYQDGQMTSTGADTTPVADGDSFSLIYTIG